MASSRNNPVEQFLLLVLFYLVITPIGMILRLFGVKTVTRGFDKNRTSYWEKK